MRYVSTVDTAKEVRAALKRAFPGVKFSVRRSTGTASAWLGVHWEDGPTDQAVRAVVAYYEGRRFNGMTDSYDEQDAPLIWREGDELPEEVRYQCDGINVGRKLTPAAYAVADAIIQAETGRQDFTSLTPAGVPDWRTALPVNFPCDCSHHCYYPAEHAGSRLRGLDLSPAVAR